MTIFPIVTAVDKTHLQPGEILHIEFSFYNVTYIRVFTSMITIVCAKVVMIWILPIASKRAPFRIIPFIPKK